MATRGEKRPLLHDESSAASKGAPLGDEPVIPPDMTAAAAASEAGTSVSDDTLLGASDSGALWKTETRIMAKIGGLTAATMFGRYALVLTDLAMLGHLGTASLSAAATGNIWMLVTTTVVSRSLSSVIATLASSACGSKNYQQAGEWLQVASAVGVIMSVVIAGLWTLSYPLFRHAFLLHETDARLAARYVHYSMLWIPPQVGYAVLNNYFQGLHFVLPSCLVTYAFVALNVGANLLLIWGLPGTSFDGLGFIGSPLATTACKWGQFLTYFLYMVVYKRHHARTWSGWSFAVIFRSGRMRKFLGLMVPLGVSALLEEGQLQTVSIMAVKLGTPQLAAHSVVMNLFFCLSTLLMGVRAAVNTRVSRHFGRGSVRDAKRAAKIGFAFALGCGLFVSVVMVTTRGFIGRLFTHDDEVVGYVKDIVTVMVGGYVLFGLLLTCMILLVTAHKPAQCALFCLVGCWGLGVPLAYVFAFPLKQGVVGCWYGLVVGYCFIFVACGVALWRLDWVAATQEIHLLAKKKVEESGDGRDIQEDTSDCEDGRGSDGGDATVAVVPTSAPVAVCEKGEDCTMKGKAAA
eukprot:Rhum_TRINITY_DN13141_c0_g1::Rhum_TRINITY_DN13141_c0_g1_i1::g.57412::m.57412/K03327/TC.MATE, SLC47A, norM, mdtK, dinF; multidrug resistance protein, MATE family